VFGSGLSGRQSNLMTLRTIMMNILSFFQ